MKIKVTNEAKETSINAKLWEYNFQRNAFNELKDDYNRVYRYELNEEQSEMFNKSPLFVRTAHHGKEYYYACHNHTEIVDLVNHLKDGTITEFELSDGAQIRAYFELFGE